MKEVMFNSTKLCWYQELESYSWCPNPEYKEKYPTHPGVFVFLILLYGFTVLISSYGNSLVLRIVSTTKSLQNVNNILIANLAISDIIIAVVCTPFQFYAALLQRWLLPKLMCKLCPFVQNVCVNYNIFNLVLLAQDRYHAIMTPLNHHPSKKHTIYSIILIWTIAIVLAIPNIFLFEFKYIKDTTLGIKPFCTTYNPSFQTTSVSEDFSQFHLVHTIFNKENGYFTSVYEFYAFIQMIVQFLGPLIYLIITYSKIAILLWNSQTPGVDEDCYRKRNSIKMMIVVVVVYAICWIPWHMFATVKAMWRPMSEKPWIIKPLFFFCHWLSMSSGCCNPFIYAFFNENFRKEVRKRAVCTFFKSWRGNANESYSQNTLRKHGSNNFFDCKVESRWDEQMKPDTKSLLTSPITSETHSL